MVDADLIKNDSVGSNTKAKVPVVKDYYHILGVGHQASQEEIKKAYRLQAKQYHPDVNGTDPAKEDIFKQTNEAYQVLGNPEKRRLYDVIRNPSRAGRASYTNEEFENQLADFIRAMFEINPRMRGMNCRGRGFGRRGCRRKI